MNEQITAIKQKDGSYIFSDKRDQKREIKIPFHTRKTLMLHLKKIGLKENCKIIE